MQWFGRVRKVVTFLAYSTIFWNWPVSAKHWMTLLGTFALRYTLRARVGSEAFTRSPSSSEHSSYNTCTIAGTSYYILHCIVTLHSVYNPHHFQHYHFKNHLLGYLWTSSGLQPLPLCSNPPIVPCLPSAISPAVACVPAAARACTAPETQTC